MPNRRRYEESYVVGADYRLSSDLCRLVFGLDLFSCEKFK